ncbi:MAG TPA: PadR family transcriptional regulator [Acidimicrobiales bacterium]|nr:PadR family transcriptional regulator [Acidimicrobiales bacterium]
MLELAILGLLTDQELHGYELKKRLTDTLGLASGVSFGSLYPALARLEKAGAVKAVEARMTSTVPQTGSLGGELAAFRARASGATRGTRGKKVYGITPAGRQLFEELLAAEAESGDDERSFALRLVFARHLAAEARLGMLERRRLQLLERVTRARARVRAGIERRDAYARSLAEHERERAEHDLGWVERLIADERAAEAAAATPTPATPTPVSATPAAAPTPAGTGTAADRPTLQGLRPAPTEEDIPR